jgi:hypothetical protein
MRIPAFLQTRKAKIIIAIVVVLIALRIALPYILLHYANKNLAEMNGYYGHVDDIDVALYRGAYQLDSIYLNKVDEKGGGQTEFFSARTVDLSLEWKALFSGGLVGELIFDRPKLRFTKDLAELDEVSKDTADFRELLRDLMPVKVNRCEIQDGSLHYVDNSSSPKMDLAVTNLYATALNLKNAYDSKEVLPASLDATGNMYGGALELNMKMNPLAVETTFDLNAEVEKADMTKLNDMFQAYAGFDVNKGFFSMYVEAAAKDGKFTGYVKPLIDGLDVVEWKGQDKKDNFFQKIWESMVGGVGEIFQNQKKDQFATKINFSGDMDNPSVNVFQAIVLVLQNAFVKSLRPAIDNQINLTKLGEKQEKEGFFKTLFGGDKDKKKKKD